MADHHRKAGEQVFSYDGVWKRQFRRRLLAWYRRAARQLPWRQTRDPYAIWVSEVMLQQTQVATVQEYFVRFMDRFPDVAVLARADQASVLRVWEGLGYYRRARHLHQAAQQIVHGHGGQLPRDIHSLRRLPGIGRYTAGAILSMAFDAREPILEANSIRVLTRLLAFQQDPGRPAAQHMLWSFAGSLLPKKDVGSYNQALMELGSRICTPRKPLCDDCPVALQCAGHRLQLQDRLPAAKKTVAYQEVHEVAVVIRRRGRVARRDSAGPRSALGGAVGFSSLCHITAAAGGHPCRDHPPDSGSHRAGCARGKPPDQDQARRNSVSHHAGLL